MQLYLNTHGTYLHVRDALFELRVPTPDGKPQVHHFAAKKVTSIVLTVAGAVSTDALRLAARHQVDIIYTDWSGQPVGRFWHARLGSTTAIRKAQLAASLDHRGLHWTVDWLTEKCERQACLLEGLGKHRPTHRATLTREADRIRGLGMQMQELAQQHPTTDAAAGSLRGLEGTAGRHYFQMLSAVVPDKYRFAGRSYRPAQDVFNAYLNYGYGILYSKVEKTLMIAGVDPYVGFMHRDDYNHRSMVYDFIEPYRVWIDKVVFGLFSRKLVREDQYAALTNGVSLAKPGKELLLEHLTDYLDTRKIRYRQRQLVRTHALQLDAHRFAQRLLGKEADNWQNVAL